MQLAYYLTVWLHILCACFWIGGMLFLPLILLPGIKNNPQRKQLLMFTGLRFRFYGYIVLSVALLTGLLNIHLRGIPFSWFFFTESRYGKLVSLKIILFLSLLMVSAIHDWWASKKTPENMEEQDRKQLQLLARWTGRILLLVSLVMAFIGVVLSRGA
jgi:putative copper export protein